MRIALVTDGISPYVIGGMQKHSADLLRHLAMMQVHVDLYHFVPDNAKAVYENRLNPVANITEHLIVFPVGHKLPGHYIRNSKAYSENIFKAYLKNEPVDLIYCKGFTAWEFAKQKRENKKLPPLVVNFHGYEMFQRSPDIKTFLQKKLLLQPSVREIMRQADAVMSYGGKITKLLQNVSVPAHKIVEIPGGIDSTWLSAETVSHNPPRRFVFIGRFERRKGIQELHSALVAMKDKNFEFTFIGPIPDKEKLALKQVKYLGEVRDTKIIRRELQNADVLVCPSYSEGMPNVILEAMACGCTVIATDVGAVATCVNVQNGIFIAPGSPQAIANAMQKMMDLSETAIMEMRNHALQKIRNEFTWESIAKKHIEEFNKLIALSN